MREILFRGRRLEKGTLGIDQFSKKGDWIEGGVYFDDDGDCYIILGVDDCGMLYINVKVDPSTFCQFTGLRDKNDKRIWEGDVCKTEHDGDVIIVWNVNGLWCIERCANEATYGVGNYWEYEVAGSIHDEEQL